MYKHPPASPHSPSPHLLLVLVLLRLQLVQKLPLPRRQPGHVGLGECTAAGV